MNLECWTCNGNTYCISCSESYTGAMPVKLQSPRICFECKKNITDEWPEQEPKQPGYGGADLVAKHGEGQIWQGGYEDGERAQLEGTLWNGAKVDILVLTAVEWPPSGGVAKVQGYFVPLEDTLWKDETIKLILPKLEALAAQVAKHVLDGKTVLTCCAAGLNRSGQMNGHILKALGYSGETAVKLVQQGRGPNALNNWVFKRLVETGK